MCTESLGNETGTCIDSNIDDFSLKKQIYSKELKPREFSRKVKHTSNNFPPPLTSISRNDGVQVKTHREEGRLVIKAFTYSSCSNYFQAERKNGRLRLSLLKDEYIESDHELDENEEEEEKVNEREESENETEFNGCLWGEEQFKEDEGKTGCKIGSGEWPSLPFCVPIS
ncbi:hypothetical protein ACJIZ3_011747 [Penstemon smallii]|uniref:FAF domain-containing protein n=1 Tax=Penstemon smallii TaxID=265156 RepID=A0ABD3UNL1_9LAMI